MIWNSIFSYLPPAFGILQTPVIAGASISDESCWSDGTDGDDAAKTMKWQIKLIDFGLARPLHPDEIPDYEKKISPPSKMNQMMIILVA